MRYHTMLLASAMIATPAFAHHPAPTVAGTGGGISVAGPDTLEDGQWFIGARTIYVRPDQRSDEGLAALAGQHIHAHNTDYNLNTSIGLAYGITSNLTVSAELPYVHRDDMREGEHSHHGGHATNEVVERGDASGIGDLSLVATYRVAESETAAFSLIGGIKVPTGNTHKRDDEGVRFETEHQPGTGSWDPIIGAAGRAKLGLLQLNASAIYQFSGKGAQDTRLGDRAHLGIALSHRFGPAEHHHEEAHETGHEHGEHEGGGHEHTAPHGHASWDAFVELTGEWEGRQKVGGDIEETSGGKSVWLTPGARYNAASGFTIAGGVGLPLWQDIRVSHPNNDYRLTLTVGKSF